MKQASSKFSFFLLLLGFLVPASLLAQEEKVEKVKEQKETKEKKEAEQIIITRKGSKDEKVIVEINGDKITVNGKSIDELKEDGDVTVRRNRIRDVWAYADGLRGGGTYYNPAESFQGFRVDSNRAMLGVTTEKSDDAQGVEVQSISKESAASKAGLKEGDVITRINDKKIETPDELSAAIKAQKPGDKVSITYLRDKKENKATAELGKWKGTTFSKTVPGQNFNFDMNDLHLDEIMPHVQVAPKVRTPVYGYRSASGPKLGLSVQDTDDGKGVKVLEVDEESNAAKAGLQEDDVITEINGKAVNSADEVAKIVRDSKDKPSLMLKLQRKGKTQNVEVKIPRKLKTADL
ncbi:MAG TPA: PDZ domain-containing protein [Chitinophagaceae bacterium]